MDFEADTRLRIRRESLGGPLVEATLADGIELQYAPLIKTRLDDGCFGAPALFNVRHEESKPNDLPMGRDLAEPGDAGIAERGAGVKAAGDGTGDERPALLGQQSEHPLLRRHQSIQARRLAVEVVGDGALLIERRHCDLGLSDEIRFKALNRTADFAPNVQ